MNILTVYGVANLATWLLASLSVAQSVSINLPPKHRQIVDAIRKDLLAEHLPASQSFAIQAALLAYASKQDLIKAAKENLKYDRRRAS